MVVVAAVVNVVVAVVDFMVTLAVKVYLASKDWFEKRAQDKMYIEDKR